jgi:enoyl-CoA hydratase/carnithine racemase
MAQQWAQSLATSAGPTAVATTKAQIYRDLIRLDVGASVDESIALINDATQTAEYREGVSALRDKRPPQF